jgi:hypothetical protein
MNFGLVRYVLLGHFIADFVFQSDWMAINKSTRWDALSAHVAVYGIVLLGLSWSADIPPYWVGVNCLGHFVQDAITSRITSRLWVSQQRHWFFVMIGFDQLLHYMLLLGTLP